MGLHCIVQKQSLHEKALTFEDVMAAVMAIFIVTFILFCRKLMLDLGN
jgi:hypothetical protein